MVGKTRGGRWDKKLEGCRRGVMPEEGRKARIESRVILLLNLGFYIPVFHQIHRIHKHSGDADGTARHRLLAYNLDLL